MQAVLGWVTAATMWWLLAWGPAHSAGRTGAGTAATMWWLLVHGGHHVVEAVLVEPALHAGFRRTRFYGQDKNIEGRNY